MHLMGNYFKAWLWYLAGPAAVTIIVCLIYWRLTISPGTFIWFDHYDMCQLELPRFQFVARELHQGRFPLWNPHAWSGQPTIGSMQPGPVYPLNLFFMYLPLAHGNVALTTWNWWFVAIHVIAALCCYCLCRDLKLPRLAGIGGAVAFSCAGYLGSVPWIDIANGISLTPLVLMFLLRVFRNYQPVQSSVLLGLSLGLIWLSGHHEAPLITSYAVAFSTAILLVYRALRQKEWDLKLTASVSGAFVLALLIAAVQLLPVLEFARLSQRWVGAGDPVPFDQKVPYKVHEQYSLPPSGLAGLVIPQATAEAHTSGFVGLTVVALALLAAVKVRNNFQFRFFLVLGGASIVYSLGANTPVHRILYEVLPQMDKARTPVRGLFLVTLCLSVMAAYGIHILISWKPRLQTLTGAALLLPLLAEASIASTRRVTPYTGANTVCAFNLFDYGKLGHDLRTVAGQQRVTVNRDELMTQLGELHGFDQLQGFVAGVTTNLLLHAFHEPRTQQLFGVTHHVGKSAAHDTDELIGAYAQRTGLYRKQLPGNPRAWIVHEAAGLSGREELKRELQASTFDSRRRAVMVGKAPHLQVCPDAAHQENARFESRQTDHLVLKVHLGCKGLVVVSDTYYPGWEASVDDQPAPILEVYGSMRGVVTGPGTHTIAMSYQPLSVRYGGFFSLAGVGGALLLLASAKAWEKRPKQPDPAQGSS
ncbi:MAG TPA: hypothetical protein VEQ63_15255 [Bryobacteraceae bacterium]|nr:hypothetical protein [Bryobacteraceae bacterium]